MSNNLTAVVVCINYSKFLELFFKYNKEFFDYIIVETDKNDNATIEVCKKNKCILIISDEFYVNGIVKRGKAYNAMFPFLKDWIALMDVDTILSQQFGNFWQNNKDSLDIQNMYGMRRMICSKLQDFNDVYSGKENSNVYTPYGIGYGFFQLFNTQSDIFKKNPWYPEMDGVAEADWRFRNFFGETINGDKEYTRNLKELPLKCYHLGDPNIQNSKFFDLTFH
jgi:hypothetical protein